MARPALVRMRNRKPCVRARRRLLGWKVRFTSGSIVETVSVVGYRRPPPGMRIRTAPALEPSSDRPTVRGRAAQGQTTPAGAPPPANPHPRELRPREPHVTGRRFLRDTPRTADVRCGQRLNPLCEVVSVPDSTSVVTAARFAGETPHFRRSGVVRGLLFQPGRHSTPCG